MPRPDFRKSVEGLKKATQGLQYLRTSVEQFRSAVQDIASTLRVETSTEETQEKSVPEESCPACSDAITNLKEFLAKKKVQKALTQLEIGEGDKGKSLETVRKYIEGENVE